MDGRARTLRSALRFGFGLLSTLLLISAARDVQAASGSDDPGREFAGGEASARTIPAVEVASSAGSLFDLLFGQGEDGALTYDIPFPFAALTQRIAAQVAAGEGNPDCLVQVLIPLGRSLQRDAAAPEYFRYPRVIVAVDGKPATSADPAVPWLKDRLYLGYQEKANAIEVISYNEKVGRFDFQIVSDYAPGLNPTVSEASPVLCMGCHQNGGPIWSEPPWEETNANPEIVGLLRVQGQSFHGVPVRNGAEAALRIAASIDRANLLAPYQELWRHACGGSARCRGELFAAMLQYRLSGKRGYETSSSSFEEVFKSGWRARWPEGLPIPDARIPNRDPLKGMGGIAGELEPLEPRPAMISLRPSDVGAVAGVIAGLSDFLPGPGIRVLDDFLFSNGRETETPPRLLSAPCAFTKRDLGGWALQVRFSCGGRDRDQLSMDGQFYIEPGEATRGTIERLLIDGSEELIKLTISAPEIADADSGAEVILSLEQPIGGLHARLTTGEVLETLTLRWNSLAPEDADPSEELRRHPDNGMSVLSVVDDFAPLRAVLTALVQDTEEGRNDALADKPIQGRALMRALFAQLGMKPRRDRRLD